MQAFWSAGPRARHPRRRSQSTSHLAVGVTVLEEGGAQHVVVSDRAGRLRLELRGASVLEGPVTLRLLVEASQLDHRILALQRLKSLLRHGRLPASLYPSDPVAARRALALKAWDAARAGASHRRIITEVLGETLVPGDLLDERRLHSLVMRSMRLKALATERIAAGARRFLG